jgi:hypothetical protein
MSEKHLLQASATRVALAQAELRPTCAGALASTENETNTIWALRSRDGLALLMFF